MFELLMIAAAVVLMYRIAEIDGGESGLWAGVTLGLCVLSLFTVPLPLVRIGLVCVVVFVVMMALNIVKANKKKSR